MNPGLQSENRLKKQLPNDTISRQLERAVRSVRRMTRTVGVNGKCKYIMLWRKSSAALWCEKSVSRST